MRILISALLVAASLLCHGCNLAYLFVCNVYDEVANKAEEVKERHHDRELAEQAWAHFLAGAGAHSEDFGRGFKAGFADYLFAGDNPPLSPLPPKCYLKVSYQNPAGYQALEDWFAGFREGVAAGRASGYHQ
jgi:hypothetical protein